MKRGKLCTEGQLIYQISYHIHQARVVSLDLYNWNMHLM